MAAAKKPAAQKLPLKYNISKNEKKLLHNQNGKRKCEKNFLIPAYFDLDLYANGTTKMEEILKKYELHGRNLGNSRFLHVQKVCKMGPSQDR